MLNIEKYKEELKKCKGVVLDCQIYKLRKECKEAESGFCLSNPCSACREDNIEWLLSEAQILNDAEKRYLKAVIKPFRDEVTGILKGDNGNEFIRISVENDGAFRLPYFKKGSMYKNMKTNKKYKLEELGL